MSCTQAGKRKATAGSSSDAESADAKTQMRDNFRNQVSEHMSKALIRRCGDCDAMFVKETGCNALSCMCKNVMCYVCRAQHIGPDHWLRGTCQHFGPTEELEERERNAAEKEAIAKVLKDNPGCGLAEGDLKVSEVSEAVKKDDKMKRVREAAELRGELWHPGMEIEGADEDMMAEVEAQMAGMDFGDTMGRWGPAPTMQQQRPRGGAIGGGAADGGALGGGVMGAGDAVRALPADAPMALYDGFGLTLPAQRGIMMPSPMQVGMDPYGMGADPMMMDPRFAMQMDMLEEALERDMTRQQTRQGRRGRGRGRRWMGPGSW